MVSIRRPEHFLQPRLSAVRSPLGIFADWGGKAFKRDTLLSTQEHEKRPFGQHLIENRRNIERLFMTNSVLLDGAIMDVYGMPEYGRARRSHLRCSTPQALQNVAESRRSS